MKTYEMYKEATSKISQTVNTIREELIKDVFELGIRTAKDDVEKALGGLSLLADKYHVNALYWAKKRSKK